MTGIGLSSLTEGGQSGGSSQATVQGREQMQPCWIELLDWSVGRPRLLEFAKNRLERMEIPRDGAGRSSRSPLEPFGLVPIRMCVKESFLKLGKQ